MPQYVHTRPNPQIVCKVSSTTTSRVNPVTKAPMQPFTQPAFDSELEFYLLLIRLISLSTFAFYELLTSARSISLFELPVLSLSQRDMCLQMNTSFPYGRGGAVEGEGQRPGST